MPKPSLPVLPEGLSQITDYISVQNMDEQWIYFFGISPVFVHPADDVSSFRMYTSQLYCEGHCKQADIVRVFGVCSSSVKRGVKRYREGGTRAFFEERKHRGGGVVKGELKEKLQESLDSGMSTKEVSQKHDVNQSEMDCFCWSENALI